MASNLTFVSGSTRFNLDDRVSFILHRGYAPTVEVDDDKGHTTETVSVQFRGAITANIRSINRLFERARQNNAAAEKVYLEYKVAESEPAWRSRIYDGTISYSDELAREFKNGRVNVDISFERDPFWEGPETALPIGNANSGAVYNCNDGQTMPNGQIRTNAAHITANLIQGDLPTPVKLVIENMSEDHLGYLWVGMNNTRPNWNTGWSFEAENAIGVTPVPMAGASGGAIAQGSLTFGQAQAILRWEIPYSLVSSMRGQRVRVLLRPHFTGAYTKFKYKMRIMADATNAVYETDWLRETETYARHWLDMFDLRMPPWLEGHTNLRGLTLELWASPTEAGTWQWAFDDMMVFAQDGFVALDCNAPNSASIIIDGDKGWCENEDGEAYGVKKFVGKLMLQPMAYHLFYFAMHTTTLNDAPIDFSLYVSGTYRPRRLTL